jgi:hypothetical protein
VTARIYIEGGGNSKELHTRCQEGFSRLLNLCGFQGKMPRLVACGSRNEAFDRFITASVNAPEHDFIALLIDSEDPIADVEETWTHLKARDGFNKPTGATNDQVLLMVTSMETWFIADRKALINHYGAGLHESALLPLTDLETRTRSAVLKALERATKNCTNAYQKGKESFKLLALLDPDTLEQQLPSFQRFRRILNEKL